MAYSVQSLANAESPMVFDTGSSFPMLTCGAQPVTVKSEPGLFDESMETSYLNTTYTDLSPATFSMMKQGQADLFQDALPACRTFDSWVYKHPEHWSSQEVLDWVFHLAEVEQLDGALFCGEAYQRLSGKELCCMQLTDFLALDQNYGRLVHDIFKRLLDGANFKKPSPPDMFNAETLGNVPDFAFLDSAADTCSRADSRNSSPPAENKLSVIMDHNELKVSLDGYLYDIDNSNKAFELIYDSGYSSGSEGDLDRSNSTSSEVFADGLFSDDEESIDLDAADLGRKCHTPSMSSDSGCEGTDDKRPSPRRRPPSTSKGNHLWEFVRDLLKDSRFNPSLLRWEDKEEGVFKFVQSEAVAQMWGRKKNNPGMTYEKLSRAMRFCRSAGYFDSVPKTGRFPKKLCFKFGQKAHGWRD